MRERKRNTAYNVLILLGVIALLCYITRVWPILLLALIGAIVAAVRLVYRYAEPDYTTVIIAAPPSPAQPTERELVRMAFGIIQRRVTEELLIDYPNARWVWENPNAMHAIEENGCMTILLSRAAGYKRAWVYVCGLRFIKLSYEEPAAEPSGTEQPQEKQSHDVNDEAVEAPDDDVTAEPTNYDLLAYSWVEDHMPELIELTGEAIAEMRTTVHIPSSILPERESWDAICRQLTQHDFPGAEIAEDGIMAITPE